MRKKLLFWLFTFFLVSSFVCADWMYNPETGSIDYYEPVSGSTLGDLGDVTLTSLANGNILYYNGTAWVNMAMGAQVENITALWNFIASGVGGMTDYDITIGDVATPDYGIARIGNSVVGRTSYSAGNLDLDGAIIFSNVGGPVTGQIEFVWTESAGPSVIRFALPKSGAGNATYNARSMLIAGPAVNNDDIVKVGYWQTTNSIFDNLACDTAGDGADLGVQNDLEIEGDIFTDSIKESTSAAGITFANSIILADGSSLSLQEDITFTGATGENLLKIPDNLLDAWSIQEGSNKYITFDTVDDEEDIIFYKSVDIHHTATHADDHALEVEADAAGYGDIKAIEVDYISGAIAAGQDEGIILLNIDETAATGGDIFGLEILATEGSAEVYGMKVGVVIGPIHQDSGTFVNPTTGTDNTTSTDVAAMIDGSSGTTTAIFENDDEYILIGAAGVFEEIEFIITTGASGAGIKPTFWYSITGAHLFTQFTPVDGTDGFRHTGVVAWDASDLTSHAVNTDTSTYDIKIIRTRNSLTTTPILGYAKTAATTEYIWDKDGDLNIRNLLINESFTSDAVQTATGDGTTTVDWGLGNNMYFTFGAQNDTFTFTAPPGVANLTLWLKQDGTGNRTATWPATVHWPGDTAPTLSTGAADVDIITFIWDGTNYFGLFNGNFY